MTVLDQSEKTVVDRVQIGAHFADCVERQRIRQFLGNSSLRPTTLPASAILIVRRLRRALPYLAPLRHKIYLPQEWEQSTTEELDRLVSQAVRPVLGPVPAAAQAVLFFDRAEWLACLAQDWLQGTLRLHWWWSVLLKHSDPESVLFREMCDSPQCLPAAFHMMSTRSNCREFLKLIADDQAAILLDRIMQAFAVPTFIEIGDLWHPAIRENNENSLVSFSEPGAQSDLREPRLPSSPQVSPDRFQRPSHRVNLPGTTRITEPWLAWVPEATIADLPVVKQLLFAQALMLCRAPAMARSIAFQRQIATWFAWAQNRVRLHSLPTAPRVIGESQAVAKSDPEIGDTTVREETSVFNLLPVTANEISAPAIAVQAQRQDELPAPDLSTQDAMEDAFPTEAPASFDTAFAGTCFLLNVALHLRLYADFTAPRTQGLELNIWDFLCLIGRELTDDDIENDPIFDALARLAGRSKLERPGTHFDAPHEWILPPAWLDAFPEAVEPQEITRGARRQLLHPAGFFLRDTLVEGATERGHFLPRWVNWVSSYIRARLVRAVGREDAAELLCRIPGRLVCTPTRVDVFYSLDAYPIEIRLAGLDRDPGWIPAAGRYVAYQFQ